jgi:hypothetical protein
MTTTGAIEMAEFITGVAGDIAALTETSDALEAHECVTIAAALDDLAKAVKACAGLINTQLIEKLAEPVIIGDTVYAREQDGKQVADHPTIRKAIVKAAVADDDGVIREARDAAEKAVDLCYRLFCSASTLPKIGPLEDISLLRKQAMRWTATGWKITAKAVDEVTE